MADPTSVPYKKMEEEDPPVHQSQPYPTGNVQSGYNMQTYGAQPGYPATGAEPGYPVPGSQPGYPAPGAQPGYPVPGSQPGNPAPGAQPGYPVPGSQPGYPAPGTQPGYPAQGAQPGYPYSSNIHAGYPPPATALGTPVTHVIITGGPGVQRTKARPGVVDWTILGFSICSCITMWPTGWIALILSAVGLGIFSENPREGRILNWVALAFIIISIVLMILLVMFAIIPGMLEADKIARTTNYNYNPNY